MDPDKTTEDDFQKILTTNITTIKSDFWLYLKNHYFSAIIIPVGVLIVCLYSAIITKIPHIFIFPVFIVVIIFAYIWQKLVASFLKRFAEQIGFSYQDEGDILSVEGTIFNYGRKQNISKIISGKYFGKDTRFFIFATTIGSGKQRHKEYYSVLEIAFNTLLPDILLYSKHSSNEFATMFLRNEGRISLEGDFNEYFNLYTPKDYEVETFQIFTPDVMQMFIDNGKELSVEMFKDKVYLYFPAEVSSKQQLINIFNLAKDIILKLDNTFGDIKGDVEDMSKYAKLT
jgi:hypothetical protein